MYARQKDEFRGEPLERVVEAALRHHFGDASRPWTEAQAHAYMTAQRRRTVGGFIGDRIGEKADLVLSSVASLSLGALLCTLGVYAPISPFIYWPMASVAWVALSLIIPYHVCMLVERTSWQTNSLSMYSAYMYIGDPERKEHLPTYTRDFRRHELPRQIAALCTTLRSILKCPKFEVSFMGRDPILWVIHNGTRIPAVVWDELEGDTIAIVPAPHT